LFGCFQTTAKCLSEYWGKRKHKMSREIKKYRSYAITISTVEDVEKELQEKLMKWIKKQDFAYGVIEHDKQGVRHAHFQVWYNVEREKGSLKTALKNIIQKYAPLSRPHIAIFIKIVYNDDWLEEYMAKDVIELLIDNVPIGTDEFYPSQEEQEKVKSQSNAVDQRFHRYAVDFKEWWDKPAEVPINKIDVARFLSDMMFHSKKYPVIIDKKNRVNIATSLYCYLHGSVNPKEFMTVDEYEIVKIQVEASALDH
jgi:hypothetical protein